MSTPAVVVTGASGLIGAALAKVEPITPLKRGPSGPLTWEPLEGRVHDDNRLIGAVVHLAGEPIADERWTEARKKALYDSRILGTRTIAEWIRGRSQRPSVLITASGVGIYGDRGDEVLTEESGVGEGFLADLADHWEREAAAAESAGVRVVNLRIGVVLSKQGGALEKMRLPFKLGLGGPIGTGRQWFPWVHLDDVVGVIQWALRDPGARGAYNVAAPGIVRQADFARALGRAVGRPAFLPAPAFALKAVFGQMAEEALLGSTRAEPSRLIQAGYRFKHPDLDPALADVA